MMRMGQLAPGQQPAGRRHNGSSYALTPASQRPIGLVLAVLLASCAAPGVHVSSNPPGAVVELDGRRAGRTPCWVPLGSARTCQGVLVVTRGDDARKFHVERRAQTRTTRWLLLWTRDSRVSWDTTPVRVDFLAPPR